MSEQVMGKARRKGSDVHQAVENRNRLADYSKLYLDL